MAAANARIRKGDDDSGLPWPGDADSVVRWIRASLQPDEAGMVRGLDDVRITVDLTGTDIERLVIDATGVEMSLLPSPQPGPQPGAHPSDDPPQSIPAEPAVVHRSVGVLRAARVVADPVRIEDIPLHIDVDLRDAPLEWLVHASPVTPDRPETIRSIGLSEDASGMSGSLRASLRNEDLSPLLAALARPLLAGSGVHLRRLSATVEQDGAEGIRVKAAAGIRWRLLSASARGTARIGVSADGVLTVRDLDVRSRNPLVAVALRAARRSVREQIGKTCDLNAGISADGPRFGDVRVVAGEELSVSARID